MTKAVCCLILALGVAACVPPKAELVDETTPAARKPANKPAATTVQEPENPGPTTAPRSGMRVPQERLIGKLPNRNDMTATTPPNTGSGVTTTPPTADKRGDD